MDQIGTSQWAAILVLVAATLPLVASVFAAFDPSTRVRGTADYFIFAGAVDVDSFLKASIGYSLQAAAIYLFFSWAVSYGVWAVPVAIAWAAGFFLVARALRSGYLDGFIRETKERPITIHGFIGEQLRASRPTTIRLCTLIVALATVIGLGGTMITEIDYSTKILLRATGLVASPSTSADLINYQSALVHVTILLFVLLYVLWGGYKAVVVTERIQVPAAYVAFVLFGIGLIFSTVTINGPSNGKYLLGAITAVLGVILYARWKLLQQLEGDNDPAIGNAKGSAGLTFIPLIVFSCAIFFYSLFQPSGPLVKETFLPEVRVTFGFGVVGAISLLITNLIWQFIDISSLQRLQSIAHKTDTATGRELVASALQTTGIEAGLGWILIIIVGLSLRNIGITESDEIADIAAYLLKLGGIGLMLVTILGFAVSVFMLSTISGFVSALSYVSYYDVVPSRKAITDAATSGQQIGRARLVTLLTVIFLYLGYLVLKRLLVSEDVISAALYAIYAFQIAIAPAVFAAVLASRKKGPDSLIGNGLSPAAVALSTLVGIATAGIAATQSKWFERWLDPDSLYVFPPLAAFTASVIVFVLVSVASRLLRKA
jgi:hypothetical protein